MSNLGKLICFLFLEYEFTFLGLKKYILNFTRRIKNFIIMEHFKALLEKFLKIIILKPFKNLYLHLS